MKGWFTSVLSLFLLLSLNPPSLQYYSITESALPRALQTPSHSPQPVPAYTTDWPQRAHLLSKFNANPFFMGLQVREDTLFFWTQHTVITSPAFCSVTAQRTFLAAVWKSRNCPWLVPQLISNCLQMIPWGCISRQEQDSETTLEGSNYSFQPESRDSLSPTVWCTLVHFLQLDIHVLNRVFRLLFYISLHSHNGGGKAGSHFSYY